MTNQFNTTKFYADFTSSINTLSPIKQRPLPGNNSEIPVYPFACLLIFSYYKIFVFLCIDEFKISI